MATSKGPQRSSAKEHFWRDLIAGQAGSGLSVRAWCLQRDVSQASFYAWRRELARRDAAGDVVPRFAEVVVTDRSEGSASAERLLQIHLDDVRLEVPAGFDSATLRTVLQLLRGATC